MLKSVGVEEIFLPKKHPQEIEFRSASISYDEDKHLTIPAEDLAVLNEQDWYGAPSKDAWAIANRHFDILFFIYSNPEIIPSIANNFSGAALWRTYGVAQGVTYDSIAREYGPNDAVVKIKALGRRFWFAEAYPQLHKEEPGYLSQRRLYLPLGLANTEIKDKWTGEDGKIFFVCPNIATNSYYRSVFESFDKTFFGLPYAIGGMQAIDPRLPGVLGFVSDEVHARNMRGFRLMFYHSTEPNHIHYHPFEAIRAGMPLVYMAGGMLDRLGGRELPGRCADLNEARRKIERILNGDSRLIDRIRKSQNALLDPMRAEACRESWRDGIREVVAQLYDDRTLRPVRAQRRKRLAVILPASYRGGSLRGAKLLAQALRIGSSQCGEPADIVFLHLDDPAVYPEREFDDMPEGVHRRSFSWKTLSALDARRAMRYAGHEGWEPAADQYIIPYDGIADLQDFDAWVVISDRLTSPLLPLRPYVLMVYDYIQRYIPVVAARADLPFLDAARKAAMVMVTTEFTRQDALQYAGIPQNRLIKVPMLVPDFSSQSPARAPSKRKYFLWTTNSTLHKNHENATEALRIYYEELDGALRCHVTGVNSGSMLENPAPHLVKVNEMVKRSKLLRRNMRWKGELSDAIYRRELAGAAFLWHPAKIDNGTFSVAEAATLGVPSLSSDYPAMREMDERFCLGLTWMDASRPRDMANQLKMMETISVEKRDPSLAKAAIARNGVENVARLYWKAIRECL